MQILRNLEKAEGKEQKKAEGFRLKAEV